MGLADHERASLADLFDAIGPDAATLCEGWATRDLAAHLVLREGRPDAGAGIVVKPLAGWTAHVQRTLADTDDWVGLVDRFRHGPPLLSFFQLPGVDENFNGFEFLVHHEDVRRAQPAWEPRDLPTKAVDAIWSRLVEGGRLLFRNATTGVTLRRPVGEPHEVRTGQQMVTLVGEPVELVMYAFGRDEHALVQVEGDPAAITRFEASRFGV
jgi:uncharacterized protein (TIGR03085 family)